MLMKRYATISADIVASTSLSTEELMRLTSRIKRTLLQLAEKYHGFWGRLVKGDSIECVVDNPQDSLRIALLLKSLVKSFVPSDGVRDDEFYRYGLRLAIGIGGMRNIDKEHDLMDGEAMYLSGRTLAEMRKKRVNYLQIVINQAGKQSIMPGLVALLNHVINEATPRQCETLFYKLQCGRDLDVSHKMGISRVGASTNLRNMGWDAISIAIDECEKELEKIASQDHDGEKQEAQTVSSIMAEDKIAVVNRVESLSRKKGIPEEQRKIKKKRGANAPNVITICFRKEDYEKAKLDKRLFGDSKKLLLHGLDCSVEENNIGQRMLLVSFIDDSNDFSADGDGQVIIDPTGDSRRKNRPVRSLPGRHNNRERISAVQGANLKEFKNSNLILQWKRLTKDVASDKDIIQAHARQCLLNRFTGCFNKNVFLITQFDNVHFKLFIRNDVKKEKEEMSDRKDDSEMPSKARKSKTVQTR